MMSTRDCYDQRRGLRCDASETALTSGEYDRGYCLEFDCETGETSSRALKRDADCSVCYIRAPYGQMVVNLLEHPAAMAVQTVLLILVA